MTLKCLLIDDEMMYHVPKLFVAKGKRLDYWDYDADENTLLQFLDGRAISLTNFDPVLQETCMKLENLFADTGEHNRYPQQFSIIKDKLNLDIQLLVVWPFTAEKVIAHLREHHYDLYLLEFSFPVPENVNENFGGVVVGEWLKSQGIKFSFFTSNLGHAEDNLRKAQTVGLITAEDINDSLRCYEKSGPTHLDPYTVFPNSKGNLLFGRKVFLFALDLIGNPQEHDNIDNLLTLLRAAKNYQLGE